MAARLAQSHIIEVRGRPVQESHLLWPRCSNNSNSSCYNSMENNNSNNYSSRNNSDSSYNSTNSGNSYGNRNNNALGLLCCPCSLENIKEITYEKKDALGWSGNVLLWSKKTLNEEEEEEGKLDVKVAEGNLCKNVNYHPTHKDILSYQILFFQCCSELGEQKDSITFWKRN